MLEPIKMASGVIRRHCVQSERALARTVERLVAVCTAEYCQASWPQDGATLVAIIACGRWAWAQLATLPVLPLPIEIPPEGMQKEPGEGGGSHWLTNLLTWGKLTWSLS